METLIYDKKCWDEPCPKIDCHKKKGCECCGLKFVSVPVGLEEEMMPRNGAFSNAIVQYDGTGEVWIYSSEGVPVKMKEGNNG